MVALLLRRAARRGRQCSRFSCFPPPVRIGRDSLASGHLSGRSRWQRACGSPGGADARRPLRSRDPLAPAPAAGVGARLGAGPPRRAAGRRPPHGGARAGPAGDG